MLSLWERRVETELAATAPVQHVDTLLGVGEKAP
jgi:hypothetical protein